MAAKKSPRRLSHAEFVKKPARTKEVEITFGDEPATVLLRAIGNTTYDRLLTEHPPTKEQKEEDATYNPDTFAPALIASVLAEPKLTVEEATEMYNSDEWSRGELLNLFTECIIVCSEGLKVDPTRLD